MIRKRNLDNSLIQWIMTQTNLGPGIGDIKYVAPAASTTSRFSTQLGDMGVEAGDLYASPTLAEADLKSYRNDIMLIMPGTYTQIAEIAWDKAHTHILGLGGPNTRGHFRTSGASDMRNVQIHTVTAEVGHTINVTGENCQFHNVMIHNEGSHATNYSALRINKYGFYGKGLNIRGATGNLANADVDCGSLSLYTDADYPVFEDCYIGHNTFTIGARTVAASGQLLFDCPSPGPGPQNGWFTNCHFTGRSETSTVGLVRTISAGNADRDWIFRNCLFTNHSANWVNALDSVFVGNQIAAPSFVLIDCVAVGFTEWQAFDYGNMIVANMPVTDAGGGLVRVPSVGVFTGVERDYTS